MQIQLECGPTLMKMNRVKLVGFTSNAQRTSQEARFWRRDDMSINLQQVGGLPEDRAGLNNTRSFCGGKHLTTILILIYEFGLTKTQLYTPQSSFEKYKKDLSKIRTRQFNHSSSFVEVSKEAACSSSKKGSKHFEFVRQAR